MGLPCQTLKTEQPQTWWEHPERMGFTTRRNTRGYAGQPRQSGQLETVAKADMKEKPVKGCHHNIHDGDTVPTWGSSPQVTRPESRQMHRNGRQTIGGERLDRWQTIGIQATPLIIANPEQGETSGDDEEHHENLSSPSGVDQNQSVDPMASKPLEHKAP